MIRKLSTVDFSRTLALFVASFLVGPVNGADVPLTSGSAVRFASLAEAQQLLSSRDAFALALSRFDRQVRLQTAEDVTLEQWLEFTAGQARAWSESEIHRVTAAVDALRPRLSRFQFQLPDQILLVRTTGKEEGDAAYTRQAAIILPAKVMAYPQDQLERLLLHELFHVVSRHDAALRQKLYAIVGFEACPEVKLPQEWEDRRITNPDAPKIDCHIDLKVEGGILRAAPFLYATPAAFDTQRGGSLFRYLTFRLLVLQPEGERAVPAMKDGKPVVLDPRGIEDFSRQIGKNTNYIVHPDEILADNFMLLVSGAKNVPTPRIIEEMERLLAK